MITGDAEAVAQAVANDLGIKRYYARVLPEDKVSIIKQLKQEGSRGDKHPKTLPSQGFLKLSFGEKSPAE